MNENKQLYFGLRKSDFTDKCVVQITMPTGDFRNVHVTDLANEDDLKELVDIHLKYEALDLNGRDVRKGPHGECVAVRYLFHDIHGIITEIRLFYMTPEEFNAQLPSNKTEGSLLN